MKRVASTRKKCREAEFSRAVLLAFRHWLETGEAGIPAFTRSHRNKRRSAKPLETGLLDEHFIFSMSLNMGREIPRCEMAASAQKLLKGLAELHPLNINTATIPRVPGARRRRKKHAPNHATKRMATS
jgi:hypothetical protein